MVALLNYLLGGLATAGVAVVAAPTPDDLREPAVTARTTTTTTTTTTHKLQARAPAVAHSRNTLPLTRRMVHNRMPRPFMRSQLRQAIAFPETGPGSNATADGGVGVGSAIAAANQIEYITSVQAGSNNLSLIIDTGSSDTWFVKEGFQCLDPQYRQPTTAEVCEFGPPFKGDFPGGQITNQHFNVTYGSVNGPFLNGLMGYSDLGVANIVARKQQIGLATRGAWNGDGITSGILGLGLPGLTAAYTGVDAALDSTRTAVEYNPLVVTLAAQNMSVFSLALSRDPHDSYVSFGGVPPNVQTVGPWVTTSMQKIALRTGDPRYMYYQIAVDRMSWNSSLLNATDSALPDFIVDSGTTMNLLPYDIARSINSMFTPHAMYDPDQQTWFVRCDAKAPDFGIEIGGHMFWTDPASMILPHVRDQNGLCISGIGVTSGFPYILGDVFMQQLVTAFDVTNMQIKFAKRANTAPAPAPAPAAPMHMATDPESEGVY
ncbi:Peptidase aspartic [Niveomyces insectorum RCEF 264]|uniref:Peptidase aspartic n=1 Tax=Niveomyces insectorum RCEF 264 TaxID=1081102 RepID=A0A168AHA9_9HYPO|nr:Peptidase aspartic [Niveomyces insectorum RCEF 264]